MKRFSVTVEKEIIVEFDENSAEFKEIFEGYKEIINPDADYEDLSENVAQMVSRYGIDEFIEGIGYVKKNSENQHVFNKGKYEEVEGCINVIVDVDINGMVEFDTSDVSEL